MARSESPLERRSVQMMIGIAIIAVFANSSVDRTDDGLPWEVTLAGFCVFAVVFVAIWTKKTEVALSIVACALWARGSAHARTALRFVCRDAVHPLSHRAHRSQDHAHWVADVLCAQLRGADV